MKKIDGVKKAVVLVKEDGRGNKCLCAYVVSEETFDVKRVKKYLSQELPDHMIPSHFVQIEAIPLTPNGKLDRRALPEPEIELDEGHVAPRTDIEMTLAKIWSEVLNIDKVGIYDNFFDIGGTSLLSVAVNDRIRETLGISMPVIKIFEYPQIYSLATHLIKIEDTKPAFHKIHERAKQRRSNKRHHIHIATPTRQ